MSSSSISPSSSSILPSSSSFVPSSSSSFLPSSSTFSSSSLSSLPTSVSSAVSSFSTTTVEVSREAFTTNVTRTTHFPLTTIYTPAPFCSNVLYSYSASHSGIATYWRNATGPGGPAEYRRCYPPNFEFQQRTAVSAEYSPGVCPLGYEAATSTYNAQRQAATSFCCPSGMTYAANYGCFNTITSSTNVVSGTREVPITSTFVAAEPYIKVAWASSQLNMFTPASAPILEARATSTANSTSPAPAGMTTEQIAGMSVGLPVAVAVIAVACYALWRRKRRMRRPDSELLGITDYVDDERSVNGNGNGNVHEFKRNDSAQVETPERAQLAQMQQINTNTPSPQRQMTERQWTTFSNRERSNYDSTPPQWTTYNNSERSNYDSTPPQMTGQQWANDDSTPPQITDQQWHNFSNTDSGERPSSQMDETQPATEPDSPR